MAETVVIRAIMRDEASRPIRKVQKEVEDLGDAADSSSRDVDKLDKEIDKTGKTSKKTSKDVDGLTGFFSKLGTNVRGLGYLFKAAKIPLYLGAFKMAVPAVGALAGGVGALVGALGPLTGAIGAVPALATSLISVIGVTKLATKGVGDAVKAMTKEGATAEEVAAAMKGLSPPARQLAKNLAALKPEWDDFAKGIAERTLPGLNAGLLNVVGIMPLMKRHLGDVGAVMGDVAHMGGAMVNSGPFQRDIGTIMGRNTEMIRASGGMLLRLVDAMRHVMVAAKPLTDAVTVWIDKFGKWAQSSAEAGRESGKLASFFRRTVAVMTTWGHILRDLSIGLFQIFKIGGGGLGNEMVGNLEKASAQFRAWTESERGISRITGWFDRSRPILKEMYYLIRDVASATGRIGASGEEGVVPFLRSLRKDLLPALEALITGIDTEKMGVALAQLAEAFAKFTNFASFTPLIDGLSMAATLLNGLLDLFDDPRAHQAATAFIGAGLALRTIGVAYKYTGLKKIVGEFSDATSATRRFIAGVKGAENGQKGLASALGRGTTKLAGWTKKGVSGAAHAAGDLTKAVGKTAAKMAVLGAKAVVATAKLVAHGAVLLATKIKMVAVAVATGAWTAAQWLLNVALNANPIGLIVTAIALFVAGIIAAYQKSETFRNIVTGAFDAVKRAASAVWEWVSSNWPLLLAILTGPFAPLVLFITQNWDTIKGIFTGFISWIGENASKLWDPISRAFKGVINFLIRAWNRLDFGIDIKVPGWVPGIGGKGFSVKDLFPDVPLIGDTARPRATSGNLANTLSSHAAVSRSTPGRQRISNVGIGGFRGSDHHRGRAVDVVGSGLQTYVRNAKKAGAYAAIHGSGQTRHAHAAYGDTTRPRVTRHARGEENQAQFILNGPLIGEVHADSEVDVQRAVKRALNEWLRDRMERA